MTAAFFIMLREGLEAALIVGIIGAYLVKVDRRDALPRRLGRRRGGARAVGRASGSRSWPPSDACRSSSRRAIEGLAALIAVVVLTWMLFWMRRQGRAMKGELEHGVDMRPGRRLDPRAGRPRLRLGRPRGPRDRPVPVSPSARRAARCVQTLIARVRRACGRRRASAGRSSGPASGSTCARFFTITGVVLIFVSAGLVAFAVHEFGEAGLHRQQRRRSSTSARVLPETSPLGSVLAGLFGYRSAPTPLEVVAYLAYLIPVLILFLKPARRPAPAPAAAAS